MFKGKCGGSEKMWPGADVLSTINHHVDCFVWIDIIVVPVAGEEKHAATRERGAG